MLSRSIRREICTRGDDISCLIPVVLSFTHIEKEQVGHPGGLIG